MNPIVIIVVLFFLLEQSSTPAPPPGNYYPNASYVPPPEAPLIPTSALPATSSWRPTRPPSLFRGTPPAPAASASAATQLNNFGAIALLNRVRAADAATSHDMVTSATFGEGFHRGV